MFAYVRILEGSNKDQKVITNTTKLNNFKKELHRKHIKYLMKSKDSHNFDVEVAVVVLLLADTKKDLESKVKDGITRIKNLPTKLLESATNSSLSASDAENKNPSPNQADDKPSTLTDKELQKAVDEKLVSLKSNKENTTKSVLTNQNSKPSGSCIENQLPDDELHTDSQNLSKTKHVAARKDKNIGAKQVTKRNPSNNVKILSNVPYNLKESQEYAKKIEAFNSKVMKLTEENESLRKQKDIYKRKYVEKSAQYEKLNTINQELQVTMIDNAKEKNDMFEKVLASQQSVNMELNFPAIGFLKATETGKMFHIGRGIWISEKEYNGKSVELTFKNEYQEQAGSSTTKSTEKKSASDAPMDPLFLNIDNLSDDTTANLDNEEIINDGSDSYYDWSPTNSNDSRKVDDA